MGSELRLFKKMTVCFVYADAETVDYEDYH